MATGVAKLFVPDLAVLAGVLRGALSKTFKKVSVEVVQSPDLTAHPWNLASKGLNGNCQIAGVNLSLLIVGDTLAVRNERPICRLYLLHCHSCQSLGGQKCVCIARTGHSGSGLLMLLFCCFSSCETARDRFGWCFRCGFTQKRIAGSPDLRGSALYGSFICVDVGGVDNLHYPENNFVSFQMSDIARTVGVPDGFFMGPGAGSGPILKICTELMANSKLDGKCLSKYAMVTDDGGYKLADYAHNEVGVLANMLVSDGLPGKVLHVTAAERVGPLNFVSCMRQGLIEHFTDPDVAVGLAGVFNIASGKVRAHVMPDFPKTDMLNPKVVDKWLRFYEMRAPLTCLSVFVSHDRSNLGLRMEHTHFFSDHGDGGHYHNDTTPESVEYDGYFVPAEAVHRIGPPVIDPSRSCFFQP